MRGRLKYFQHLSDAGRRCRPIDASTVMLELRDDKVWQVVAVEFIGGASSSDFVNEWFTGEEAVSDILDFYFGDPKKMEAKATALNSSR